MFQRTHNYILHRELVLNSSLSAGCVESVQCIWWIFFPLFSTSILLAVVSPGWTTLTLSEMARNIFSCCISYHVLVT